MSDTRPSVAVIGCGAWGMNHVRVWREMGCLAVACDTDPVSLRNVQARFPDVTISPDVAAVIEQPDITAVVIAAPAPTHATLAAQAMEAGKDVLVEKPMAMTVAEGKGLVEITRRSGRVLAVGHVLEYHPAIRKLSELIRDGVLGRVQYLYSNRLNLGRIRTEENALWSFAPHDIAIILRLLGTMPEEVVCRGGAYLNHAVADVTLTSLSFPGDVRAHVFVSWLHPFKEHRFVVVGDRQMAVFDDTLPWPEKLTLYPHRVGWIEGQVPVAQRADAVPVTLDEAEPLRAECEHFLECVKTRATPVTDVESGLRVLRVLEAAQQSMEHESAPKHPTLSNGESGHYVHPTATIDAGARIGRGTRIWHHSHVMANSTIGSNCVLGQNVFVGAGVRIGNGVKIQNNVSVFEGVELEDYVFCGPSMVFTNVLKPRSEIERKDEFRKTLVKRGATLGAGCTLICGTTIGRYAFVGAGAVVSRDVPDYALVAGLPARRVGWVCQCAERLEFDGCTATCPACGKRYTQSSADTVEPDTR